MPYDTVYRWSETEFTGVPLARVFCGHWYWPKYEEARDFAAVYGLPRDRIVPFKRGWAIQLYKSGPYVCTPSAKHQSR